MADNKVNELIQDMCRVPEGIARLRAQPEQVFDEYGLDENQKDALRTGDPMLIVERAGVHPILAMHYLFVAQPQVMEMMSLVKYPELIGEKENG